VPAKRFASKMLNTANVWTLVFTAAANKDTVFSIHCVNHNQNDETIIDLAIVPDTTINDLVDEDTFIKGQAIFRNSFRAWEGIPLQSGYTLAVKSSKTNVSVLAYGFEENVPA